MQRIFALTAPALLVAFGAPTFAQNSAPALADTGRATSDHPSSPSCSCLVIPALTPVSIEVMAAVGSKTSKTGDIFPIRLAAPIVIAGRALVPAGAAGTGEVIHAKKSSGGGAAGELVLAARYVEVNGQHMNLRSLDLSAAGKSNIAAVDALNVASVASPVPINLIGFFVHGGQVTVPEGTVVPAKTREDFTVPASADAGSTNSQTITSSGGK